MIEKDSVQASMDLARDAVQAGYMVVPQPNSPLYELVNTTKMVGGPLVQSMENLEEVPTTIHQNSNNIDHNNRLDYFVKTVVEATNTHLSFIKNVVIAAVESTSKRVMAAVGAADLSPVAQFTVVEKSLPPPLAMDTFREAVAAKVTGSYLEPEKQLKLEPKGPVELLDMLKTGSGLFDEEVIRWWNLKGDVFFVQLWENLFMSAHAAAPERIYTISEIFAHTDDGLDAAIAVFLIASKLQQDPPRSTDLSTLDLNNIIAQHQMYAARKITNSINEYADAGKNAVVVLGMVTLKKTITVYSPTYRAWLKDGGKPEVLFGLLINNGAEVTVAQLNDSRQKYLQSWEAFKIVTTSKFKNDQFSRFITELRTAFYQDMSGAVELERSYEQEDPTHLKKVGEYLEQQLSEVTTLDQADIVRCVARVVCKARYYHTDAYKVIVSIDEATRTDPNLSVEAAVSMASNEYVADFVAAQMRLA